MTDLSRMFNPRNVAILGASTNLAKRGNTFVRNLIDAGFQGNIYPINPNAEQIHGLRAYPSINDIDDDIDLVMNALSPALTPDAIAASARRGIPFGLVFTAGFAETGTEGRDTQERMVADARAHGMRLIGPNSMGMFNLNAGLNLTSATNLVKGPLSIVSQSGNVGITLWHQAKSLDIGFSKFVGVGNQSDLMLHEYVEYLGDDPDTAVILMYVESIKPAQGQAFVEVARRVTHKKPIVLLKGGRTVNAQRAAASHTAAMASPVHIYMAALEQAGVIVVDSLEQLLPIAETLYRCPPFRGKRAAVIGSGGGHSILAVDAAELNGFDVEPFSDPTRIAIEAKLPTWAFGGNPVDMTGAFMSDLGLFAEFTELAHNDRNDYGGTLAFALYGMWGREGHEDQHGRTFESAAPLLGEVQSKTGKPVVFYSPYATASHGAFTAMRQAGVPVYGDLDLAARALRALREHADASARPLPEPPKPIPGVTELLKCGTTRPRRNLTEWESYRVLESAGIPVVPHATATNVEEARRAATQLGLPVVMKVHSPDIIHKTDVNGVAVNLQTLEQVEAAYDRIATDTGCGDVLIASYRPGATELIAGAVHDSVFGPCLMLGAGGIHAEALRDFSIRVLPTNGEEISSALRELRVFPILQGQRGAAGTDIQRLTNTLLALANLIATEPQIAEMDLNPILVRGNTIEVADARIIVAGS